MKEKKIKDEIKNQPTLEEKIAENTACKQRIQMWMHK